MDFSALHLSDADVMKEGRMYLRGERGQLALQLSRLGEIDARRLYAEHGYRSMHEFCVCDWELSEDEADKRIQVARKARMFPVIFAGLADGRFHLSGLLTLVPRLSRCTSPQAEDLLAAAAHKSRAKLSELLAERYPRSDVPTVLAPITAMTEPMVQPAPTPAASDSPPEESTMEQGGELANSSALGRVKDLFSGSAAEPHATSIHSTIEPPAPRSRIGPLAPQRFAFQITIDQSTRDDLRKLQDLLGYSVAAADLEQVLKYALRAGILQAEKTKFAATEKPRIGQCRASKNPRHIPARVKRAVYARDQGRCTFVSASGRHCTARRGLEFDHITEVARGGDASVENIRLRCRAHNLYTAGRTFGARFMEERRTAKEKRARAKAAPPQPIEPNAPAPCESAPIDARTPISEAALGHAKAREVIRYLDDLERQRSRSAARGFEVQDAGEAAP